MNLKQVLIKNKAHIFFIFILLILELSVYNSYITTQAKMGDYSTGALDRFYLLREIILKHGQFPHWDPIVQGGSVAWAHPNFDAIYYSTLLALISPSSEFTLNFLQFLNLFLAGLFMYYVMIKLKLRPPFAFISACAYMFSIYANWLFISYYFRLPVITWLPLLFYFTWKAIHSKDWLKYSIYSGIVLTIIFLSGGLNMAFFCILVFISIFLTHLIGKHFFKRLTKAFIVSILILAIFLGLFSIKIFPMLEYNDYIATKAGTTYEEGVGSRIKIESIKDFIYTFVFPKNFPERNSRVHLSVAKIGITGILLIIFSLYKIKKRHVLFFLILSILGILVATGSPVYYLFWKFVPGFNRLHYVIRASFIFLFAFAALQGIGLSVIYEKIKKKFTLSKKIIILLYLIVVSLVLIDLLVVTTYGGPPKWVDFQEMIKENHMMQYLKKEKEKEIFRINNIKTKDHGGWTGQYATYLNLELLYGGHSIWYPEFYVYLGLAHSHPAKFYGMLNTKYIYSNEPINVSGLKFFRKFPECEICRGTGSSNDGGIDGPSYLYLNEMYVPRAYIANYSILIVGNENAVKQNAYGILINDNFNPANTVVVMGEKGKINNYDINFLKHFDVILLSQDSIDESSGLILKQYVNSGGILLPNIVNGINTISQEDINNVLSSFKGDYSNVKKVNISLYTPNKRVMDLKGYKGFLVTAEKYFWFEGWKAKMENENRYREILRANGMNSAVYLDGEQGDLIFKYLPKSFKRGLIIFSVTLFFIIVYFIVSYAKRKTHTNKNL